METEDFHCSGCDVYIENPTQIGSCSHGPWCEKCMPTCIYCEKLCCPECCYNNNRQYDIEKMIHAKNCNKKCLKYKSFSERPRKDFKVHCKYRYCINCLQPCEKCNGWLVLKNKRECDGCLDFTVVENENLIDKRVCKFFIENEDFQKSQIVKRMLEKYTIRFMKTGSYTIWTKHCKNGFSYHDKVIHPDRLAVTKNGNIILVYVSDYGLETLKNIDCDLIIETLKTKGYGWVDDGDWHEVDSFGIDIDCASSGFAIDELGSAKDFDFLANFLFSNVDLKIGKIKVEIVEIEFYLNDNFHPDPFAHQDEHQSSPGKFYFHRQNGKSYKGGTYKGLDITFRLENSGEPCYGGILIRSIKYKDQFIEGPCKVVDFILAKTKKENITELIGDLDAPVSVVSENFELSLVKAEREVAFGKSPRVGLSLSKCKSRKDSRMDYIMRPYRYYTSEFSTKIKKYKCLVSLNFDKCKKEWKEAFERGKNKKFDFFKENGISTVSNLCEFYGFWVENYE